MKRPDHAVQTVLSVPFHDCDPLGVVWHGRYFEYLEAARCELFKTCRLDIPDVKALGLRMFVSEARCRYNAPLCYGDSVSVLAWFSERDPLIRISYDLFNETKSRLAGRASTRLALTNASGELLSQMPDVVRERLPA